MNPEPEPSAANPITVAVGAAPIAWLKPSVLIPCSKLSGRRTRICLTRKPARIWNSKSHQSPLWVLPPLHVHVALGPLVAQACWTQEYCGPEPRSGTQSWNHIKFPLGIDPEKSSFHGALSPDNKRRRHQGAKHSNSGPGPAPENSIRVPLGVPITSLPELSSFPELSADHSQAFCPEREVPGYRPGTWNSKLHHSPLWADEASKSSSLNSVPDPTGIIPRETSKTPRFPRTLMPDYMLCGPMNAKFTTPTQNCPVHSRHLMFRRIPTSTDVESWHQNGCHPVLT